MIRKKCYLLYTRTLNLSFIPYTYIIPTTQVNVSISIVKLVNPDNWPPRRHKSQAPVTTPMFHCLYFLFSILPLTGFNSQTTQPDLLLKLFQLVCWGLSLERFQCKDGVSAMVRLTCDPRLGEPRSIGSKSAKPSSSPLPPLTCQGGGACC